MNEQRPSKELVEKPHWVPDNALRRLIRECDNDQELKGLPAYVLKGICLDLLDRRTTHEPAAVPLTFEEDREEYARVRGLSDEAIVRECIDSSLRVVRELANRYDVVCEKLEKASEPPLDARYCPFNHKPCEPIDLAEETSETKSETVMSKVREHFDAQRDRDGYHSELERLEFAPPADPGPSFDMLGELKKRLMWCPALVGSNPHEWNGDGKCRHCGGERPSAETSETQR